MKHIRSSFKTTLAVLGLAAAVFVTSAAHMMSTPVRAAQTQGTQAPTGLLTGTVLGAAGEKIGGVTISARADGQTFTTTVFTDAEGKYYFPALALGKYRVWAQAVGYATGRGEVDLAAIRRRNFSLKPIPLEDIVPQLMGDQLIEALPADTPQDRKLKAVVQTDCVNCHPTSFLFQNRFDEAGWRAILDFMSRTDLHSYPGEDAPSHPSIVYHTKDLAAYLARVRGPGLTELKLKIPPRPTGEAARAVVIEYDVPLNRTGGSPSTDSSDWEQGVGSDQNGVWGVHDAVVDFEDNIWFTNSASTHDRTIGRIDAKTGKVTNVSSPKWPGRNSPAASAHGMVIDQKGIVWFDLRNPGAALGSEGNGSIGRIDPKTGQTEVFTTPKGVPGPHSTAEIDARGGIWDTTDNGAVRFDPETKEWQEFKVPFPPITAEGTASFYGSAGDSEGNGWWVDYRRGYVFKGDLKTGKVSVIKLPRVQETMDLFNNEERKMYTLLGSHSYDAQPWSPGARRLGADLNGDSIWVCLWYPGMLAKINMHTLAVEYIPIPSRSLGAYKAAVDSQHRVWFNGLNTDRIFRYDPRTKEWASFDLPSRGTETRFMSMADRNGRIQVISPYYRQSKIARMTFRTEGDILALRKQVEQTPE